MPKGPLKKGGSNNGTNGSHIKFLNRDFQAVILREKGSANFVRYGGEVNIKMRLVRVERSHQIITWGRARDNSQPNSEWVKWQLFRGGEGYLEALKRKWKHISDQTTRAEEAQGVLEKENACADEDGMTANRTQTAAASQNLATPRLALTQPVEKRAGDGTSSTVRLGSTALREDVGCPTSHRVRHQVGPRFPRGSALCFEQDGLQHRDVRPHQTSSTPPPPRIKM
ncbi:hypothetical protein DFH09DRAFT_1073213 [Mycena vulgaris]|nr:hypothetical protein DFH09DRAFT_1073213 [Mycena vulgaris]